MRDLRRSWRERVAGSVAAALAWRYGCHAAMLLLSLWNEGRPAPHLPDTLLDRQPPVAWLERWNWWLWVAAYIPVASFSGDATAAPSSASFGSEGR